MSAHAAEGMKVELKYLVADRDRHGTVRHYVRRGGRKTRIRAEPGTPAFLAAYEAALAGETGAAPAETAAGTLRWLARQYFGSAAFRRLGPSTRRVRRAILEGVMAERFAPARSEEPPHGDKPFARMEPQHVRIIRDVKAELPAAANARVKALRQLFAWAADSTVRLAAANPAAAVPYLASANPDGFHSWTMAEVAAFEARHPHGTRARLALAILLFTGVRRSDAVRLGRQMERDGWLVFAEAKGRARRVKTREIPILPELRAALDAAPSGHLTWLVTAFGKPFTPAGFGNWFRRRCDEAGLAGCAAHGLRKAGAAIAAGNGATEHELMAIYGWETSKQAAVYTRQADRRRLAGGAMHLLVPAQLSHPPAETVPPPRKRLKQNG